MPRKKKQDGQPGGGKKTQKKASKNCLDEAVADLVIHLAEGDNTKLVDYFQKNAEEMYPNIGQETYRVPDVHINKGKEKATDEEGVVEFQPQVTDTRSDRAHTFVSDTVYKLTLHLEKNPVIGPFFIISSYEYDNYLSRFKSAWDEKLGAAEPENVNFPKGSGCERGEVDIIIILPKLVVFVEIKATGDNFETYAEDKGKGIEAARETIKKAIIQLERDEKVFNHVMKDLELQDFRFVKIAALPNLEKQYVDEVIKDESFKEEQEPHKYKFLCKEDMPKDHLQYTDFEAFQKWWMENAFSEYDRQKIESSSVNSLKRGQQEPDSSASANSTSKVAEKDPHKRTPVDEIKIIVGRYVGLSSVVSVYNSSNSSSHRIEVRRKGQAVWYAGKRMSDIVLTNDQKKHLDENIRLGYLCGPPGSGKTVVLAIKARRWIQRYENFVVVVNMYRGAQGRAIGKQIFRTITEVQDNSQFYKAHCMTVGVDVDNFSEQVFIDEIRNEWKDEIGDKGQRIMFIVDETYVQSYWKNVFNAIRSEFSESSMWCAGLYGKQPENFTPMELKLVIRCPPTVQHVLSLIDWDKDRKLCYVSDGTKANLPTNGPAVLTVAHRKHGEFASGPPSQCPICGNGLVKLLQDKLEVEKPGEKDRAPDLTICSLKCSDILFLVNMPRSEYCANKDGHLDTTEERYVKYMEGFKKCTMLETLKAAGYPYNVHSQLSSSGLLTLKEEVINVTWIYTYQGLENKVIIFVPGDDGMPESQNGEALAPELTNPLLNIPCPGLKGSKELQRMARLSLGASKDDSDSDAHSLDSTEDFEAVKSSDAQGSSQAKFSIKSSQAHACEPQLKKGVSRSEGRDQTTTASADIFTDSDVKCYTRWDQNNLFISASRCTSQLILITR